MFLGKTELRPDQIKARLEELKNMPPKEIRCKVCDKQIYYTPSNKMPPVVCPKSECSAKGKKQKNVSFLKSEKGIIREGRVIT